MKRILIAVCGLTPQILLETLYALYRCGRFPGRVILLTTAPGAKLIHKTVLGENGQLAIFLRDHGLPDSGNLLSPSDIFVPMVGSRQIEDITSLEESKAFQDLCMRVTWDMTRESDAVDFSIAGGRKTMSACLALAAQCYGRAQDELFHVLVAPELEGDPRFFYPQSPDEEKAAHITLAHIPYFRLRSHLPSSFLHAPQMPETLLENASLSNSASFPSLTLNIPHRTVCLKDKIVQLSPVFFALFLWFVQRKREYLCDGLCLQCQGHECFTEISTLLQKNLSIAEIYAKVKATSHFVSATGITDLSQENFLSYKSRLNKTLRTTFELMADYLEIHAYGQRPSVRYGIRIPKAFIHIEEK